METLPLLGRPSVVVTLGSPGSGPSIGGDRARRGRHIRTDLNAPPRRPRVSERKTIGRRWRVGRVLVAGWRATVSLEPPLRQDREASTSPSPALDGTWRLFT